MESYEKKYKEALERARKIREEILNNETIGFPGQITDIFPELAESEDERIAEELIGALMWQRDNIGVKGPHDNNLILPGFTMKVGDVLAYLEKQKEPQNKSMAHEDSSWSGILTSPLCKDKNLDDIAQEYVEGVKEYNPTPDWNLIHTAVCYGYHLAEQKEQKPAEWSEEDELMRSACIVFVQDEKFKGYERSYECVDWLKSLPERFSLQPKSEWSEEDEKLFWGLTAYIPNEELERLGVTRDDILKKLKSISLQSIQLKEAYKEGFQTARHATALAFMKYLDENRPEGKMCLSNGEYEEIEKAFLVGDWEKIERYLHKYHWKPSEEQMDGYILQGMHEPTHQS